MQYTLYIPKIQPNYNFIIHSEHYRSDIEIPCNSCLFKRDNLCTGINDESIENIYSILSSNCEIVDVSTIKQEKFKRIYTKSIDFQINKLSVEMKYKISNFIDHI